MLFVFFSMLSGTLGVNFIYILQVPFCTKVFLAAFLYSTHVSRKKLLKALLYKKCMCKMLMKLTTAEKAGEHQEHINSKGTMGLNYSL